MLHFYASQKLQDMTITQSYPIQIFIKNVQQLLSTIICKKKGKEEEMSYLEVDEVVM